MSSSSVTVRLNNLPVEVRLERLEALVAASRALNLASGLDDILQTILTLVSQQLDCERATVFLRDERTSKLHARQMTGSAPIEIVLERGVGLAGHVAETGESVLLDDVHADSRFDAATDKRIGFRTCTMLCVALRKPDGELLGAVQAINKRDGLFSQHDLAYLESFALLAAVAVHREQLVAASLRAELLSTELALARRIQSRLLPPDGLIETLSEPFSAWGRSQACYDVGGDTYDAVMLASGELAFWVADVSGKGIGAALLMTTLQTELRALIHAEPDTARLAAELNRRVGLVAPLGTYATLFLGVLDPRGERLRFTNAGHLPPVWITSDLHKTMCCDIGGTPVGLLPNMEYETGEADFRRGSRLAIFSDGITDAESLTEEMYDEAGIAASLSGTRAEQAVEEIGAKVFRDLDRFRIGAAAKDDTTFLVVGFG